MLQKIESIQEFIEFCLSKAQYMTLSEKIGLPLCITLVAILLVIGIFN